MSHSSKVDGKDSGFLGSGEATPEDYLGGGRVSPVEEVIAGSRPPMALLDEAPGPQKPFYAGDPHCAPGS